MRSSPTVTRVHFSPAPPLDVADGLLGFLAVDVEGLRLDGVALRRTRAGGLDLRYPQRAGRAVRWRRTQVRAWLENRS